MRITIIAIGSFGDIAPMVALACGLHRVGHNVRLVAPPSFRELVLKHQLAFAPLHFDLRPAFHSEDGYRLMEQGTNPLRCWRLLMRMYLPLAMQLLDDLRASCRDTDAVGFPGVCYYPCRAYLDSLGIPSFASYVTPLDPLATNSDFPVPLFPPLVGLPKALVAGYNQLSYPLFGQIYWQHVRSTVNRILRNEGLAPDPLLGPFRRIARGERFSLYGHSTQVLPRPASWPRSSCVTGYWFLDEPDWTPPQPLVDFLAAGPPPVYVGFGSMTAREPRRLTRLVVEALRRAGQRGVLLSGWAGLGEHPGDLPEFVHRIDSVPHGWLFPRVRAAVHHGGAGTLGAAVRAGIPSVIVPFFLDQPFWGQQAHSIGAAGAPTPISELTAERLAASIQRVLGDANLRASAADLGRRVRAEDGVARGVEYIEELLARCMGA